MNAVWLPRFEQPDLASVVEALPPEALDSLDFGVIRLDAGGAVQIYSEAERRLSGSGDRPRLGLDFFSKIAPCMDQPGFRGRIERAIARGRLDLEFSWTGDFSDRMRSVTVRVQSASSGGGYWIFMRREDD
jgi:photoactive yellow protein